MAGVSDRAVRDALKRLEACGLIKRVYRRGRGQGWQRTEYELFGSFDDRKLAAGQKGGLDRKPGSGQRHQVDRKITTGQSAKDDRKPASDYRVDILDTLGDGSNVVSLSQWNETGGRAS